MITRSLWQVFTFKVNSKWGIWNSNYSYSESEIAWLLIRNVLLTPFTIILDITTLPIQIIYWICLKIIKKIRR